MAETTSFYKKVSKINVLNGGSGFTSVPTVSISGGGGQDAQATATLVNGVVTSITVTNSGYNFVSTPTVTISSSGSVIAATAEAVLVSMDGPYNGFKQSLSFMIANQLPDYVRNEFPQFVLFLEKYYEFLDLEGEANNVLLNIQDFSDINKTLDIFLPKFKQQYLTSFPKNTSIDDRTLIKFIRDFYESKGSEKSLELLFRMFYGSEIEVIYPSEQILRASDGIWTEDTVIRITLEEQTTNPFELSGKFAKIYSHKTTGSVTYQVTHDVTVTDVRKLAYITPAIYELTIQRTDTNTILIPGAAATATANLDGTTIDTIDVNSGGSGYYAAPTINILSSTGTGAAARAVLDSTGSISNIVVTNPGSGYLTEPVIVFDNTNIRTRIQLATDNTTIYGYIIRVLNLVSIGEGALESGETNYGFRANQIYQIDEAGSVGPYAVSGYFAGDYVASGLDNNASIKIETIDEDGFPTEISIFYSGYAFEREIFDFTIVSPNGGSVDLTFTTGAEYTRPGRFKDSRGMLSNVNKLQDNFYYQNYSYVIRSGIPQNRWINVVKNTVHPAGMAVFGELNINQIVDYSPNIGILEEKLHLYEFVTDSITISDSGMSAFTVTFVKVLTDSISTPTDVKTIAVGKNVTDATGTSTDVKTITIGKNVSDSATSSDAVNSITFSKVLADSVTVIESLIIGQVRDFADSTASPTDDDVISFGKNVSDSISTPTDDDTISFGKVLTDSISTPTDAFNSFVVGKVLTDSTSPVTEATVVTYGKVLTDSTVATETTIVDYGKSVSDSISSPTDDDVISVGKNVSDSISTPTDAFNSFVVGKNVTDSATSSEAATINNEKVLTDSVTSPTDSGNINIQNYWAYDYTSGEGGSGDYVGTNSTF